MKCLFIIFCLSLPGMFSFANTVLINTPDELKVALTKAQPGDTILLANKTWNDASLLLEAKGSKERPVTIQAQTMGGVVFSGKSDIRIAGEYLIIKGFHFKNGYTMRDAIITFRIDEKKLANNCRVTECVIEDYSKPGRFDNDNWVVLWGKNNRIDHCTFKDKLNAGPVLIAELNDERSQQNYHIIDSNYFAGRQRFGSNGGETIRIGVSRYSLTASHTQIIYNYFERCNGEVEIVSVKSGENNISHNTFYECEGGLVLRHGAKNIVCNNIFLGNNKPFTGGVRIINPGHTIANNIFKDLSGTGFHSALAIMNGVPNSLINRYYQVTDVNIFNNTFINCASLLLGLGKDAERTLSPQRVSFHNNLLVNATEKIIIDENKDGGILFTNNGISQTKNNILFKGFAAATTSEVKKDTVLLYRNDAYGARLDSISIMNKENTGARWYRMHNAEPVRSPQTFPVKRSDSRNMNQLIKTARPNDTILLTETGNYTVCQELIIDKPLAIVAAAGMPSKPVFVNGCDKSLPAFIVIENGGSLHLKGIAFNGAFESFGDAQAGIRSSQHAMNKHYKVHIDGCEFYNFNESGHAGFMAGKSTYADSVLITNSLFRNISGTGINVAEEKDDKGIYGAEYTIVKNCVFTNILGAAINVYRGGNDESTTGPSVTIDQCTFNEVENREQGSAVKLIGAQYAFIKNCNFVNSGMGGRVIEFREFERDPILIDYCNFYHCGRIASFYDKVLGKHIYKYKTVFMDIAKYNFNLKMPSALQEKSSEGAAVGAVFK